VEKSTKKGKTIRNLLGKTSVKMRGLTEGQKKKKTGSRREGWGSRAAQATQKTEKHGVLETTAYDRGNIGKKWLYSLIQDHLKRRQVRKSIYQSGGLKSFNQNYFKKEQPGGKKKYATPSQMAETGKTLLNRAANRVVRERPRTCQGLEGETWEQKKIGHTGQPPITEGGTWETSDGRREGHHTDEGEVKLLCQGVGAQKKKAHTG